jgi:hypothetical protein
MESTLPDGRNRLLSLYCPPCASRPELSAGVTSPPGAAHVKIKPLRGTRYFHRLVGAEQLGWNFFGHGGKGSAVSDVPFGSGLHPHHPELHAMLARDQPRDLVAAIPHRTASRHALSIQRNEGDVTVLQGFALVTDSAMHAWLAATTAQERHHCRHEPGTRMQTDTEHARHLAGRVEESATDGATVLSNRRSAPRRLAFPRPTRRSA